LALWLGEQSSELYKDMIGHGRGRSGHYGLGKLAGPSDKASIFSPSQGHEFMNIGGRAK